MILLSLILLDAVAELGGSTLQQHPVLCFANLVTITTSSSLLQPFSSVIYYKKSLLTFAESFHCSVWGQSGVD